MAFSTEEQAVIKWGKDNGKSVQEIKDAVFRLRTTGSPADPNKPAQIEQKKDSPLDFLRPTQKTEEIQMERKQSLTPEAVMAEKTKQAISAGAVPLTTDPLSFYRDEEKYVGIPLGEAGQLVRTAGRSAIKSLAGSAPVRAVGEAFERGRQAISGEISTPISGIRQTVSELAERVPRFGRRVAESAEEAAVRAERIRTATPSVQQAIKTNLDDRIINTVEQADQPTLKAYKEIIDIAESATGKQGGTIALKQRPEIVAGRAAEQQFDLIEKQRKAIGTQIGEAVDKLSKTTRIPLEQPRFQMEVALSKNGIEVGEAGRLSFTSSKFTPVERAKIQALYDLATEGGEALTPRQIYNKDQLFSKLQRESRFEGVGDIIVETEQGNSSLFRVFRDIFTNTLDDVSPDDIRALNKQYRNIVTLQDDIEGSLFKSGNFDQAAKVDGAEFAKTNLRRLLSDAQSAPIYQAIAREMDKTARGLGYEGANPEQLIAFATELRNLYPEAVPATSATGIVGSLRDVLKGSLDKVLDIGAPDVTDQQKALRALIEDFLQRTAQ